MTELDIHKKCSNPAVFARGRAVYKRHMVKLLSPQGASASSISAEVTGSYGGSYRVSAVIGEDSIGAVSCTCPYFAEEGRVCKHIVAALLESLHPAAECAPQPDDGRTTTVMRAILEDYGERACGDIPACVRRTITLEPVLRLDLGTVRVEFRVGETRMYIIKSIPDFVRAMEKGEYMQYGKGLGFVHSVGALDEHSRTLYEFMRGKLLSDRELVTGLYRFGELTDVRQLVLTARDLDELFDILEGETVSAYVGDTRSLTLRRQNPILRVTIEGRESRGAVVYADKCRVFSGSRCCYVCRNGVLYRCDEGFSADMEAFLKYVTASSEREISISRRDLPAFCATVLPALGRWVQLRTLDIALEDFSPPPESFSFYLDMEALSVVTCRAVVRYGEREYNLITDRRDDGSWRNTGAERRVRMLLDAYFTRDEITGELRIAGSEEQLYSLLDTGIPELQAVGEVFTSDAFRTTRICRNPRIAVGVKIESDLLRLELDFDSIPPDELRSLLMSFKQRKKFYRLRSGEFVTLEGSGLAAVSELAEGLQMTSQQLRDGRTVVPSNRSLYVDAVLKMGEGLSLRRDHRFRELVRNMKAAPDAEFELPESLYDTLRSYQRTGFRWMRTMELYGFGGILADDMGLGKTLQVITLLLSKSEREPDAPPSLIVTPASLVYNWQSELVRFAPTLRVAAVAGSASEREQMIAESGGFDVLVTSYDLLRRDIEHYESLRFTYCVLDEAQYIKNQTTLSARCVKRISARTRFALTGTPIENRLSELWSIFDFLMPGFLYSYSYFRSELEAPIVKDNDELATERLHKLIAPFILRRLKSDVLKELPEKLEDVVYSQMETEQRRLYDAGVLSLLSSLKAGSEALDGRERIQILSQITRLRQLCCDPSLCVEGYGGESAKLETCMELLGNAISGGHKVLVFSQFTSMLAILQKKLEERGILYYIITGSTTKEQRLSRVSSFNRDDTPVFLISLKAGGTGLNLTGADIVIHYDPWWNLAAQNQATDRAHRIGQKKVVNVIRLIAKNTIEEKIVSLQESKRQLAETVIEGGGSSDAPLSREEFIELLT